MNSFAALHAQQMQDTRYSRGTRGRFSGPTSPVRFGYINKEHATLSQLTEGLGGEIDTIPVPTSKLVDSTPVSIQNFQEVASYSWKDSTHPIIVVPGSPPVWKDRDMPYNVSRDTGIVPLDHNAKRLSTSPLLPLIVAVSQHAPSFPLASVDFVTDRNGLRLWRWATGNKSDEFRIDVELVGTRSIIMERWGSPTSRHGSPGYERNFEKESTTPAKGCEGTSGHHRIVTYDLDGLKILMRHKVDATLHIQENDSNKDPLDMLASELGGLSVSTCATPADVRIPTFGGAFLTITSGGVLVPQSSVVELKTRSRNNLHRFDWDDAYPQLLLSRTSHMFLCVHERGQFYQARKRLLEEIGAGGVAKNAHENLRNLRDLLGKIGELARRKGQGKKLSLVCTADALHVYDTTGGAMSLPPAILKKFV